MKGEDMSPEAVVVIGSGPSGAAAAVELVRAGVPVTMLESGTAEPSGVLLRARGRNLYRRVPEAVSDPRTFVATGNPETLWYQHLGPGGLSNQWTGAVPRFAPRDFDEGSRLDERYRWPLTYDDLAPWYETVERQLAITAAPGDVPALPAGYASFERHLPADWQAVARVAARHGQGLTVMPLADGPDHMLVRRGTAFNSFTEIVQRLVGQPGFELRVGAHAVRLEWSGARRRVEAVLFHDRATGAMVRLPAAGVIVACGALASTKLLFDSACPDFPEGLGNTEGLLGRYLHDHLKEWWVLDTERPLSRLAPSGYLTRRPYESSPPLQATSWTIGNVSTAEKVKSLVPSTTTTFGVQVFGAMVPVAEHSVQPSATGRDEHGLPQLEVHIDFSPAERQIMVDAREHLLALLTEAGYPSTAQPVVPQLVPGTAVHYGGTIRMHGSRHHGVLDQWCRPFDIPNVVVGDAACFTTNSEKNPTLTAMALAARAAARLAGDLRAG